MEKDTEFFAHLGICLDNLRMAWRNESMRRNGTSKFSTKKTESVKNFKRINRFSEPPRYDKKYIAEIVLCSLKRRSRLFDENGFTMTQISRLKAIPKDLQRIVVAKKVIEYLVDMGDLIKIPSCNAYYLSGANI